MSFLRPRPAALLLAGLLLAAVGCGAGASPSTDAPADAPNDAPAAPSTAVTPTGPTTAPLSQVCGAVPVPQGVQQRLVPLSSGTALSTAWTGSGTTVAVLLHQTDGNGLCGFLFYADRLAHRGVRVALLDLCGFGQSACVEAQPGSAVVDQVRAVVDLARREGARRVVLVGASMGGSAAVSSAGAVRADGLVDLSGPAQFHASDLARDAPTVTMPALFAYGRETDPADLEAVREVLPAMPTRRKALVTAQSGHGYDLLREIGSDEPTRLSAQVADFVRTGRLP